jgi:hypothetical protein
MVEAVEMKYGQADGVWVMDCGMVSEDNLRFIRERGGSYIAGTLKAMLRQFEQYMAFVTWKTLLAWMEKSGLGSAPRTVVEELARAKSGDVVPPPGVRKTRTTRGDS